MCAQWFFERVSGWLLCRTDGVPRGKVRLLLLAGMLAVVVLGHGFLGVAQERVFRAGAATANITPFLGSAIVGGFRPVPSTYVHDELLVRCLVLDDGRQKLAFVLCDNVGIPREVFDQARTWVQQEVGIRPEYVLMASTHTHSGVSARNENDRIRPAEMLSDYQRFVARRIADAVRCAVETLRPARIGWGTFDEPSQVFNRRWFVTDPQLLANPFGGHDRVRMNPPRGSQALDRPAGPVDPQVSLVFVQGVDGRPISLLANYALHYVGGVPPGHISADYFGVFAAKVAEKLQADSFDPPFVAMMSNGTSGNINNIDFRSTAKPLPPYAKMHEVAELLARRTIERLPSIQMHDWVALDALWEELPLKVRKPSQEQLQWARQILASDQPPQDVRQPVYARRFVELAEAPDTVEVPIQVVRLGDLAVVGIPFEVFVETGLHLKKESPFGQTFVIELANGSYGYLPTPEHHELGGYETWLGTCNVEEQAATKIAATALELLARLHAQPSER
ncbi:MAG: hypothetical protein KatS3mg110_4459 [Pirellulaceae bacterium]|nr:MAG: hypothetical protein KatS3mg110_4459 [Pirellulaceae bacterium]